MNKTLRNTVIHIVSIVAMLIVACCYFYPVLDGKVVEQGDMQKANAMAHEQKLVAEQTGKIPNWNPSMFSGMPGYQIVVEPQRSVFTVLKSILIMRPIGLEGNIGMLWLYLIGFYVAMVALLETRGGKKGLNALISFISAVAFGLGSYNIIICEAGHITKGWAIAMIAPMLAGMVLSLRSYEPESDKKLKINFRRLVWGFILFTVSTGLQITFNHIQITYYTVIGGVILGATYLVYAIKDRWIKQYGVIVGVLLIGCFFALGGNYRHLAVNQEYAKATMRGGSEITVHPSDYTQGEATLTGGLDINYAFSWSYGVGESYTLIVPGAMGGGSGERVGEDSEWSKMMGSTRAPLYWGDQPFTSGPVYFGAIVIFLFIVGCFVVRGPEFWWLLIATIVSIVMSWGRNCMFINEFLFNTLPLYNKFRTPSMSLVLANTTMVMMAGLTLHSMIEKITSKKDAQGAKQKTKQEGIGVDRVLWYSMGIAAFILIVGMLVGTQLRYTGANNDGDLKGQYLYSLQQQGANEAQIKQWEQMMWPQIHELLKAERKHLFMHDSWRSLVFIGLAFLTLLIMVKKSEDKSLRVVMLCSLCIFIVLDLWIVDRRYLNGDNFIDSERNEIRKSQTEIAMDQIAKANGDTDYRIFDLTVNTFNDSRPSAYHHEIGGYSAAKLRRYQDLIDFYLGNNKVNAYLGSLQIRSMDTTRATTASEMRLCVDEKYPVLDMLNARYLMLNLQGAMPVRRNSALGSCWFVDEVKFVEDANAEILSLDEFDPKSTVIVDRSKWGSILEGENLSSIDTNDKIELVASEPYNPDHLTYRSKTSGKHVAVFSEVYYAPDWRAYIDGEAVEYFRADYILRAMVVPEGEHTIEFRNEAPTLNKTDRMTLMCSILMMVIMVGCVILVYLPKKRPGKDAEK